MAVDYKLIVNDSADDVGTSSETFVTVEGPCTRCVKPQGDNTLIGMKTMYLNRTTMKVWLKCIVCHEITTMKSKI